jgi:hypothetical protein
MSRTTTRRLPVGLAVLAAFGLVLALLAPASSADRSGSRDRSTAAQAKKIAKLALRTARKNAAVVVTRGKVDQPILTTLRPVQSLRLSPGNWMIVADITGAHNGTASSSRLECVLVDPRGSELDFAKFRTQANVGAQPIVFADLGVHGATRVSRPGFAELRCGSSAGSSYTLTTAKMTAVRVSTISTQ